MKWFICRGHGNEDILKNSLVRCRKCMLKPPDTSDVVADNPRSVPEPVACSEAELVACSGAELVACWGAELVACWGAELVACWGAELEACWGAELVAYSSLVQRPTSSSPLSVFFAHSKNKTFAGRKARG
nr:hypothetical protein BgiMline_000077 [Biomphalaria glabrata]